MAEKRAEEQVLAMERLRKNDDSQNFKNLPAQSCITYAIQDFQSYPSFLS